MADKPTGFFPVSYHFLEDPETFLIMREFAEKGILAWLILLSMGHKRNGFIYHDIKNLARILRSYKIMKRQPGDPHKKGVPKILQFFIEIGWLQENPAKSRLKPGEKSAFYLRSYEKYRLPETKNTENVDKKNGTVFGLKIKIKNKNKSKETILPEWLDPQDWQDWVEQRINIRKPLTPKAVTLSLNKLTTLRDRGNDPKAVIEQSIERGYTGLFQVNGDSKPTPPLPRYMTQKI